MTNSNTACILIVIGYTSATQPQDKAMATFFVTSGSVLLGTGAVGPTDTYRGGVLVDDAGQLNRASTTGGAEISNGLLRNTSGQTIYHDATAGLPADTQWCNGLPLRADGSLCVSTNSVSTYSNGIPFVANGAVAVGVIPS